MGNWDKDRAKKRIDGKISALPIRDIEIKEYIRDTNLSNLPANVAYRVNGAHLYADILNLKDMLHVTTVEGETCHKRTLRFLNLHYRAVHRIIAKVDSIFVDFHNQRLHTVFAKPYGDEAKRVHRAVATAQLIIDVLARILKLLGDCDLIIDATANPDVVNILSAVSAAKSKPIVWAEIFGGGMGGLIARCRPGLEPSPQHSRNHTADQR